MTLRAFASDFKHRLGVIALWVIGWAGFMLGDVLGRGMG